MRACPILVAIALAATSAHADGVYFAESFGVGMGRGELQPVLGNAIHSRITLGARVKWIALEAWLQSNMQFHREGAWQNFLGGEPGEGRADLEQYGFAVRAIAPLYQSPNGERLEGYVRLAPGLVGATGALDGYRGMGIGTSAGIQLTGKVRALGFLWAPLFFVKKGPKVTGALFLDGGWDFVRLRRDGMSTIDARVGHVSVGFAIGSTF
jgi:hypothetical protein